MFFLGVTDDLPKPVKQEVKDWKYINLTSLQTEINQNPENYSEWMKICLPELRKHIEKNKTMNKLTP